MARDRAGVVVLRGGAILMTLAMERRWREGDDGVTRIPIRWLGGKLDDGESFAEAAVREVEEEVATAARLAHAPATYVSLRGSDTLEVEHGGTAPAPLLVSVRHRGARSVSYRATLDGEPRVGDVPGIVWVPLTALALLAGGVPFARFAELGIRLVGDPSIPEGAVAHLGGTGTEDVARRVVAAYGPSVLLGSERTPSALVPELALPLA